MTDSDEEPIPNDATMPRINFLCNSTQYNAMNPNMTGLSSRNNVTSNTLFEQSNFRRKNLRGCGFDQRSCHYRRGTSAMSMVSESRQFNRDYSYCQSEMGGSIRSNDTVGSAIDIADAIRNAKFKHHDLDIIKFELNKYYKNRSRRRIEKRRKLRRFFKFNNRKSGEDSGEQGSDSSLSSDDIKSSRSVKTLHPKNNILKPRNRNEIKQLNHSIKEPIWNQNFTEKIKPNIFLNKCNSNNSLNSIANRPILNEIQEERVNTKFLLPSQRFTKQPILNGNSGGCKVLGFSFCKDKISQKDIEVPRNNYEDSDSAQEEIFSDQVLKGNDYSNKFLSKTVGIKDNEIVGSDKNKQSLTMIKNVSRTMNTDFNFKKPQIPFRKHLVNPKHNIHEKLLQNKTFQQQQHNNNFLSKHSNQMQSNRNEETIKASKNTSKEILDKDKSVVSNDETDSDEIFANITVQKNSVNNISLAQKRPLEESDKHCSERKRSKVLSPNAQSKKHTFKHANDNNIKEIQHLATKDKDDDDSSSKMELNKDNYNDLNFYENNETQSNKSCFEKSSFIKRKLFTQKLDILENKNSNGDNLTIKSPQVNPFREKNKVRKLATSHSYLSRDICEDNVLELIHKIVPPDQMNLTNVTNKTTIRKSNQDDDKWDVMSVISKCENGDVSDTFTDEEIFKVNNETNKNEEERNEKCTNTNVDLIKTCKIVVDKIPLQSHNMISTDSQTQNNKKIKDPKYKNDKPQSQKDVMKPICNNVGTSKRPVTKIRSFWDTDSETDIEGRNEPLQKSFRNINQDNESKEVVNKKLNENRSLRVAMLTLHSLKNSFISTFKKSPDLIPNQKINNIDKSDTSAININQENRKQNKQIIKTVTEATNTVDKKKSLVSKSYNKNEDNKKKKEIGVNKTNVSKKNNQNDKNKTVRNQIVTESSNEGSHIKGASRKKNPPTTAKRKDVQANAVQKKCSTAKGKPTQDKEKVHQDDSVSDEQPSILTRSLTLRTKADNNNSIISNFNTNNRTKYGCKLLLDVSLSSGEHGILTRSMRLKALNISDQSIDLSSSKLKSKQNLTKQNVTKQNKTKSTKHDKNNDASLTSNKNKYTLKNNNAIRRTPRNKKNGLMNRKFH